MAAVQIDQTPSSLRPPDAPGTVRVSASEQWFPEFVYEVVAHRVGDIHSITLIATGPAQPRAYIEHFAQRDPDELAAAIRDWLVARALETSGVDDRILDWAFRIGERVAVPVTPA